MHARMHRYIILKLIDQLMGATPLNYSNWLRTYCLIKYIQFDSSRGRLAAACIPLKPIAPMGVFFDISQIWLWSEAAWSELSKHYIYKETHDHFLPVYS